MEFVSEKDSPVVTKEREILDEDPDTPGILLRFRQPVQKKTENENGRVYSDQFWKEAVFNDPDTQERLENGLMVGQLTHPDEGVKVNPSKISNRVAELIDGARHEQLENHLIYGTVEVYDTPAGRIENTLIRSGTKLGKSSRALVDYHHENGKEMITDGVIKGFDSVLGPSVVEALPPSISSEDIDALSSESGGIDLSASTEEVVGALRQESTESDSAKLICESIDNSVNENLDMSDEIQELYKQKKQELEETQDKLEDKNEKIENLQERIEELESEEDEQEDSNENEDTNEENETISLEKAKEMCDRVRDESRRMMKTVLEDIREVAIPEDRAVEKVEEFKEFAHELRQEVSENYVGKSNYQENMKSAKDFAESLKTAAKKAITRVLEKAKEREKRYEQKVIDYGVRMLTEHRLKQMGREHDQEIKQYLLSSESIKEARNRADEIEEYINANKEGEVDKDVTERKIREKTGKVEFDDPTTQSTFETLSNMS